MKECRINQNQYVLARFDNIYPSPRVLMEPFKEN